MTIPNTKRIFGARHYKAFSEALSKIELKPEEKIDIAALCCVVFKTDNVLFNTKKFAEESGLMEKKIV